MSQQTSPEPSSVYENNPFYIGLNGMKLLFSKANSIAILAIVLCVLGLGSNGFRTVTHDINRPEGVNTQEPINGLMNGIEPALIAIIVLIGLSFVLAMMLIGIVIGGIFDHAASRTSEGRQVSLGESIETVFKRLPGYAWVWLNVIVRVFLWSLLLIVPGIVMAYRYSLSGVVFFSEGKKGGDAVKRSLELTKGAWLTTFASQTLWSLMTFGIIQPLLQPSANAVLYRQLRMVTDARIPKPAAHWLSWLTLTLIIGMVFLLLTLFALIAIVAITFNTAP